MVANVFDNGATSTRDHRLLQHFIADTVKHYSVLSVIGLNEPGEADDLSFLQVLAPPRKVIAVTTPNLNPDSFQSTFMVRSLEWNSHDDVPGGVPTWAECYDVGETFELDLVSLLQCDLASRKSMRTWTKGESNDKGVFRLTDPQPLRSTIAATSPKVSLLSLWDACDDAGLVWVDRKMHHTRRSGQFVDIRMQHSRPYIQCRLASRWIFDQGQGDIVSRKSHSYYLLLLCKPGNVPSDMPTKDYIAALRNTKAVDQDPLTRAIADVQAQGEPQTHDVDIDYDERDVAIPAGDLPPVPAPIADGDPDIDDSVDASIDNGSSSRSCSIDGSDDEPVWPDRLEGVLVRKERHASLDDTGLRVTCSVHGCRKFRSLGKAAAWFGPRAPQYYLGCWLSKASSLTANEHRAYSPPRKDIKEYIERKSD